MGKEPLQEMLSAVHFIIKYFGKDEFY